MSGERPKPPRPVRVVDEQRESHMRPAEPFAPAVDVTLEGLHRSVVALTLQQSQLVGTVEEHVASDERRSGLIHEELALIRATLLGDHAPRLAHVERTLPQRVGGGALAVGKYSIYVTAAVAVLNALAKQWPWLSDIARALGSISL